MTADNHVSIQYEPTSVINELYGSIVDPVLSFRAGPDQLSLQTFRNADKYLKAVLYWYRNHISCHDGDCRCRFHPRAGDGFCVLVYRDGTFGACGLLHGLEDAYPDWQRISTSATKLTRKEFERLREDWADPALGARRWREPGSAFVGIERALAAAIRHGTIPPADG